MDLICWSTAAHSLLAIEASTSVPADSISRFALFHADTAFLYSFVFVTRTFGFFTNEGSALTSVCFFGSNKSGSFATDLV